MSASATEAARIIRWRVAHGPKYIVEEGVRHFGEELNRLAPGRFQVQFFLGETEVSCLRGLESRAVAPETSRAGVAAVQAGVFEIGQLYSHLFAPLSRSFEVLDAPFLFDNDLHVEAFISSDLSKALLDSLKVHGLTGLGFTYSGGFRVLASPSLAFTSTLSFDGAKIASCGRTRVFKKTYASLKASSTWIAKEEIGSALNEGSIDGFETVYPRLFNYGEGTRIGVVSETFHSLHMTAVVINSGFFDSLSVEDQRIVQAAATFACTKERECVRAESIIAKQKLIDLGVSIRKPTKVACAQLRHKFTQIIGPRIVSHADATGALYNRIRELSMAAPH